MTATFKFTVFCKSIYRKERLQTVLNILEKSAFCNGLFSKLVIKRSTDRTTSTTSEQANGQTSTTSEQADTTSGRMSITKRQANR